MSQDKKYLMHKIILEIRKEMEPQGVSTPKLLERMGISNQNQIRKVNRLLSGDTKRLDMDLAEEAWGRAFESLRARQ